MKLLINKKKTKTFREYVQSDSIHTKLFDFGMLISSQTVISYIVS